jgi:CheY-like chemotaxis protein
MIIMDSRRILVVEKEAIDGAYVRNMLERIGWSAVVVRDRDLALARMEEEDFAAVLVSSTFLVGDAGNELTQQLRNETPVIGIANYSLSAEQQRFQRAGIDNYITKPIYQRSLVDVLETAIARPA